MNSMVMFKDNPMTDGGAHHRASVELLRRAAAALRKHAPDAPVLRDLTWWLDQDSEHDGTMERLSRGWHAIPRSRATVARDKRTAKALRRALG